MANTFDVDAAILAQLSADSALHAFAVDGIFFGEAPPAATKFVLLGQIDHSDELEFGDVAWETILYQVKAVQQSTSVADVKAAAARIQAVMLGGTLAPTGYQLMHVQRTMRIRYPERDPTNADLLWQHGGGRYEVWVMPTA